MKLRLLVLGDPFPRDQKEWFLDHQGRIRHLPSGGRGHDHPAHTLYAMISGKMSKVAYRCDPCGRWATIDG